MTIGIVILAILLCIVGIVGSVMPGLPGPPLNYIAMLLIQWQLKSFETSTLIIFGILTAIILVVDYVLPIWFAKKFGATKQGIWGSIIGMIAGMIFTPVGMILGMLAGAVIGDMIAGRNSKEATQSGIATFFGTLFTIGIKLGMAGVVTGMLIVEVIAFYSVKI